MKKIILLITLLILSCSTESKENKKSKVEKGKNKNMAVKQEEKYMTLEEFNKKYFYWDNVYSFYYVEGEIKTLDKYIRYKEKDLEKIESEAVLFENLEDEKRVKQILNLLIELRRRELYWSGINEELIGILSSQIYEFNEKLPEDKIPYGEITHYKREFFKFLEKNYNKDEIKIILEELTIDVEHNGYIIDGRYGLEKVDEVISELEKVEKITSEEWQIREGTPYKPLFKNEVNRITFIYLLDDNRVVVVDKDDRIRKEIKVKNYKEVELIAYKEILYIYDDGKIYEYSLINLDNVKVIDLKKMNL